MKPSAGRIVIYNDTEDAEKPGSLCPALIQAVHEDGSVRLFVFGATSHGNLERSFQGDAPGQWNWFPRI